MKLVNSLVVAFLGTLMAAGCTVTDDTSNDGGTGTDGGGTDTAKPPTDTAGGTDTATSDTGGGDAGTCSDCIVANCKAAYDACQTDTQCKNGVDCLNACPASPTATRKTCQNTCVTNAEADAGGSPKIDDLAGCLKSKCSTPCDI